MRPYVLALLSGCSLTNPLAELTSGGDAASDVGADAVILSDSGMPSDASDAGTCALGFSTGLVAYYPLDEGQGVIVHDCTQNHHDGTILKQQTNGNWVPGKRGTGVVITAPTGCMDVGMPAGFVLQSFTLAMWAKMLSYPSQSTSGYFGGKSFNADIAGWRFATKVSAQEAGLITWEQTWDAGGDAGLQSINTSTPGPPLNEWHHVAATFAANDKVQMYIDGSLAKTTTGVPPIQFDMANIRFGCRGDDSLSISAVLDEIRFYDHALTGLEIAMVAQ